MAVFRVERTKDYTVMSNYHLRDTSLSLTAKGLLSQMLSLPDNWDYTLAGLAQINREGKSAIRSAVNELEQAGYIRRRRVKGADGKFSGNEYIIHEQPVSASPSCDFPTLENPSLEKPTSENPSSENPSSENRTELNIDILNTNIPPNPPKGDGPEGKEKKRSRSYKAQADILPERFEKFWKFYREHVPPERNAGNRQQAIRAWDKLAPSDDLVTTMARSLEKQVNSQSWATGVGIPHASTWLNNHGWEDDWGPASNTVQSSASPPSNEEVVEWVS